MEFNSGNFLLIMEGGYNLTLIHAFQSLLDSIIANGLIFPHITLVSIEAWISSFIKRSFRYEALRIRSFRCATTFIWRYRGFSTFGRRSKGKEPSALCIQGELFDFAKNSGPD